ncbi:MAG: class I SAM-dependent methyltransferase [Nevskiales bacterium]
MSGLHGVIAAQSVDSCLASQLAAEFKLPLFDSEQGFLLAAPDLPTALLVQDQRLTLRRYESPKRSISIGIDPQASEIQRRVSSGRKQVFARALGLHKSADLHILDATAGLGRDALVMHGLGATVTMLERSPELQVLLQYSLAGKMAEASANGPGLQLLPCMDAVEFLTSNKQCFDVIYLDPMYPATRSSALPKKEMQLLRGLLQQSAEDDKLLDAAIARARRVVVKRPPHGEALAGCKPHHSTAGKRVRYDVYLKPNTA